MNNNWLKKLVGAALALAFVVSSAFIPGLSFNAEAAAGDVQSTGFESSTGTITGSSTAASITDEQAASGSHSLKVAPSGNLSWYKAFAVCDDGSTKIKVKANTRYRVSLKYKIGACAARTFPNDIPIYIQMASAKSNVWDAGKDLSSEKTYMYSKELKSVEWTRHDYIITTGGDVSPNLVVSVYCKSGDVVYIDDLVLTELGPEDDTGSRTFDFSDSFPNFAAVSDNAANGYTYGASQTGWHLDNGYLHFPTTNKTNPSLTSAVWIQHFGIYDTEFWTPGPDKTFNIKVKIRYNAKSTSDTGYFSIATKPSVPNMNSGALKSLAILKIDGTETDWKVYDLTVSTGSLAEGKALFMTFGASSGSGSFDVEYLTATVFDSTLYDFNADYSGWKRLVDGVDNGGVYASSGVAWDIDPDTHILHFPTSNNNKPDHFTESSVQKFSLYNGSYCKLTGNTEYRITVRYKQVCTSPSKVGFFGLGYETSGDPEKWSKVYNLKTIVRPVEDTSWKTYTVYVRTPASMNNRHLVMTFGTNNSNGQTDFYVDYVKVEKGWHANNNGIAVDYSGVAAGSELPEPEHADGMTFLGWYSDVDFINEFGPVLENEYRRAYAKYSKLYIGFNEGGFSDSRDYKADITKDPLDPKNKVAVLPLNDERGNIEIARYDASDAAFYALKDNTEYTVSYRYLVEDNGTENTVNFQLCTGSYANYVANDKTAISSTSYNSNKAGEWVTVTRTFTTGYLGEKNHLYITALANGATNSAERNVYIDDVVISENAAYADVTVNENGYITTVTSAVGKALAAGKNTAEKTFIGWYGDPDCTAPFGNVMENETRIAYAKYDIINQRFENIGSINAVGAELTADPDNANNKVLKFTGTGAAEIPSYDAAGAGRIGLAAKKLYVVRFRYKRLAGSAAGAFTAGSGDASSYTVLGTGNAFDACADGDDWNLGALAFKTDKEESNFVFGVSGDGANVLVDDIKFYEAGTSSSITVKGDSTINGTSSSNAYLTVGAKDGKLYVLVTVDPADGEQLAASGISVTYDAYGSAFSEEVTKNIFETNDEWDPGHEFDTTIPASAKNIRVNVTFTTTAADNMAIIASSYREKTSEYTTGVRFRARIYTQTAASLAAHGAVTKTGFLVTPTRLMETAGQTTLTMENYEQCKAVNAEATGVIYDSTDLYTDYQVLLKGNILDKMKDTEFTVVAYQQYTDGTYLYTDAFANSYNKIYKAVNVVPNGVTEYYKDEFEGLRNDLRVVQQGNFSYLYITDLHIDYVKSSQDAPSEPAVLRTIHAMVELANTTDVDFIMLGGDIIHGTSKKEVSIEKLRQYVRLFKEANVPVFVTKGNHDANEYSSGYGYPSYNPNCVKIQGIISLEEWYQEMIVPLAGDRIVHDSKNAHSSYYYVDFPEKKTRLIVTDCYDAPFTQNGKFLFEAAESWRMYSDAQMHWLIEEAYDASLEGWTFIQAGHAGTGDGVSSCSNVEEVKSLISAFNNHTTYENKRLGLIKDFSAGTAINPLYVFGHTHTDAYKKYAAQKFLAVNTAHAKVLGTGDDLSKYADWWVRPERLTGTLTEALFDAQVYGYDGMFTRLRFGAGIDQKIDIKDYLK